MSETPTKKKGGGPKGHPNWNTSKDPLENGGCFGHFGRGPDTYQDDELERLGKGVVEWIQQKNNIWMKYYFQKQGMRWGSVQNLMERSERFKSYIETAKEIQESKLLTEPYFKKADGNHARFMLARHHKGEWEDKTPETTTAPLQASLDNDDEKLLMKARILELEEKLKEKEQCKADLHGI